MDMETSLALQLLRNRLTELENRWKQRTTAETTPTAPTPGNLSAAATASMTPTTPPSLQSDQAGTPSGHVEPSSGCAHERRFRLFREDLSWADTKNWWCQECGVLMSHGRILVPAAATTSSTSVKQHSRH